MKDRPIIFTYNIDKIIDGTKTMTRRVVKPQLDFPVFVRKIICLLDKDDIGYQWQWRLMDSLDCPIDDCSFLKFHYGHPLDRLWVKEKAIYRRGDSGKYDKVIYFADGYVLTIYEKWVSPLYMPRWASRILLEIEDVRAERVQDISEEDAIAEGCCYDVEESRTAREAFRSLWDAINAKRGYGWDKNPWVWVIKFKLLDSLEKAVC